MANYTVLLLILAISAACTAVQGKAKPSYNSNSNSNKLERRDIAKDTSTVDFRNIGSGNYGSRDSEDPTTTTPAADATQARNKKAFSQPSLAAIRHKRARLAGKAARAIIDALTEDLGETAAAAVATAVHRVVEAAGNSSARRNYNVNSNSNLLGGQARRSRKQSQRDDETITTTTESPDARDAEYSGLGDFALPDISDLPDLPDLPDFPSRPGSGISDVLLPGGDEPQTDESLEDDEGDIRGHGNVNLNSNTNHFVPKSRRYGRLGQSRRRGSYNINTNSNNYRRRSLYDEDDDPENENATKPSRARGIKTAPRGSYNSNSNTNTFRRATYNSNANSNTFARRWHG